MKMINIINGKEYFLNGCSSFYKEKYRTTRPSARIDRKYKVPFRKCKNWKGWNNWLLENHVVIGVCSSIYWDRAKEYDLPLYGIFYYTHIQNYGELVHESEIELNK